MPMATVLPENAPTAAITCPSNHHRLRARDHEHNCSLVKPETRPPHRCRPDLPNAAREFVRESDDCESRRVAARRCWPCAYTQGQSHSHSHPAMPIHSPMPSSIAPPPLLKQRMPAL